MNIKSAQYADESGKIVDVEIEHPKYGWIPYTFIDDSEDTSFDKEVRAYLVNANIKAYVVPLIDFEDFKLEKVALIDAETKASIITIAGSLENQSNLQAKSTQLTLKELRGTITADEVDYLNDIEALYEEIEKLIIDGNARETQIKALMLNDYNSLDDAIAAVEAI